MSRMARFAVAAMIGLGSAPALADDTGVTVFLDPEVYIAGSAGISIISADSGGLNTAGPHLNSNDDDLQNLIASGAVGLSNFASVGPVSFRMEGEFFLVKETSIRTDSFPGPPGPITFFYRGSVEQLGFMASLWADYQPVESLPLVLSVGAGAGVTRTAINVNDTVVAAAGNDTTFTYMAGLQAAWNFDENWTLALTGRYIDMGKSEFGLRTIGGGAPSGNYTLDMSGFQAMATVRLRFPI